MISFVPPARPTKGKNVRPKPHQSFKQAWAAQVTLRHFSGADSCHGQPRASSQHSYKKTLGWAEIRLGWRLVSLWGRSSCVPGAMQPVRVSHPLVRVVQFCGWQIYLTELLVPTPMPYVRNQVIIYIYIYVYINTGQSEGCRERASQDVGCVWCVAVSPQ